MVKRGGTKILVLISILLCYFPSGTNCDDMRKDPRIVNGKDATYMKGHFSYHALIVRKGWSAERKEHWPYYGGAIISKNHVLTCARCVSDISVDSLEVVVGNVDLNDRKFTYKVEKNHIHEQYDKETLRHNIALIQIKDRFTWNAVIRPILLMRGMTASSFCYVTGFGKTGKTEGMSSKLLYAEVNIANKTTCKKELPISDEEICAAITHAGTCGGDAGAPLNCYSILFGVLTYSAKRCEPGYGAYCDITKYFEWIEKHGGPVPTIRFEDDTSFASKIAPASPVLNFISLLFIIFIGKIVGNL